MSKRTFVLMERDCGKREREIYLYEEVIKNENWSLNLFFG